MRYIMLFGFLCVGHGLAASAASGQTWEIGLGRVIIDHDGEHVPPGLAISGRHVWANGAFVGLEMSLGIDERQGTVCGGFIFDPSTQCIPETVVYSGGVVVASAGIRWRLPLGSDWALGIAPRAGWGVLWTNETGKDTKRNLADAPSALLLGAAAEGSYALSEHGISLLSSVGIDYLRIIQTSEPDGWQPLLNATRLLSITFGVAWASR